MAVKRGLAAIQQFQQQQEEKKAARDRPRATWFKWPDKSTNTATVRFLQEFDESAEGYKEGRGLALVAVEHQAPGKEGFKRRANCTLEDGACYACERHRANYEEGWRQRVNMYINALVTFDGGEPEVMVISRNNNSAFAKALLQEAIDDNTVTDTNYRIVRSGTGTDTVWTLKKLRGEPFDDSEVEVFDLDETVLRDISYEEQPAYYGAVYQENATQDEASGNGSALSEQTGNDEDAW